MEDRYSDEDRMHTVTSRRSLICAAGSFALVSSGLWIPALAEEADAADGMLGGRHGRNQRGRDRGRNRGNKKKGEQKGDRRAPGTGSALRDCRLYIVNQIHNDAQVTFYFQQKTGFDSYADPVRDKDAALVTPNWEADYAPGRFRIGASITMDVFNDMIDVNVRNMSLDYPTGRVLAGRNLSLGGAGGTELVSERRFNEGEGHEGTFGEMKWYAELGRLPDSDDNIEWRLKLKTWQ